MSFLATPGSSPLLSSAEAVARLPHAEWRQLGPCFLAERLPNPALQEVSGCIKIGTILFHVALKDLRVQLLVDWVLAHPRGTGKLIFAFTWHGTSALGKRFPLEFKRALKATERSVRWFENEGDVSPAAIAKLGLIEDGYDFTLVEEGDMCWIAVTHEVQNADAWTKFDMERPRRNAKNGMTPPKLASMMVHLAGHPPTVLDPFCGSGTIVAGAMMAGSSVVYGSDVSANILADARQNIGWAQGEGLLPAECVAHLTIADARKHIPLEPESIDAIITEGYLGAPLQGHESQAYLEREAEGVRALWEEALPRLHRVLKPNGCIITAWPSYKLQSGSARMDISPLRLGDRGFAYEPFSLVNGTTRPALLYVRPDQHIGRRIVKMRKITERAHQAVPPTSVAFEMPS